MTKLLLVTNVIVGILVIADMLYGRHMAKKMMCSCNNGYEEDYAELSERDAAIENRVSVLEEKINKPKRTSKKKTSTRKRK